MLEKLKQSDRKLYSLFEEIIWWVDLANIQLISKYNIGFSFLSCVFDSFSKYAWLTSLKNKKSILIINAFTKFLDKTNHKQNKIWVARGSDFTVYQWNYYYKIML